MPRHIALLHFCQLLSYSSIDLEFEYIFGKPMKCRFQRCIVLTEILSNFHARVEYISVTKYAIETVEPMGQTTPKSIHSLEARGPLSNTWMPGVTPFTTPNNIRIKSAILPQYTLQTDRPTNRWSRRMFLHMSPPLAMLIDSHVVK